MMDLRTWDQGLRTEGLDWTGLEGLGLEGLTGSAAPGGRRGLALSGDLIRGGLVGIIFAICFQYAFLIEILTNFDRS